jgi:predicted amidophosphoribosyltransferase
MKVPILGANCKAHMELEDSSLEKTLLHITACCNPCRTCMIEHETFIGNQVIWKTAEPMAGAYHVGSDMDSGSICACGYMEAKTPVSLIILTHNASTYTYQHTYSQSPPI